MRVRGYHTSFGAARRGDEGSDLPTPAPPPRAPPPPSEEVPPYVPPTPSIPSGAGLTVGQAIASPQGKASLVHQADGNVVIYLGGAPVWSTNTAGVETGLLSMQRDGNLVLYTRAGAPIWASNTATTNGFLIIQDDGAITIHNQGGAVIWTTRPPIDVSKEALILKAMSVLAVAVPPVPAPDATPTMIREWARSAREMAVRDANVANAINIIESVYPPEPSGAGGLIGAIQIVGKAIGKAVMAIPGVKLIGNAIVRAIEAAGKAIGSVIKFISGGNFPTPADYEPENLCVTAWTDPPKFILLSALAAIIFPPALLYMGAYAPPSPVGLTAGVAQAFVKDPSGKRVVDKILEPIFEMASEYATAILDFALNGKPALVRWALKKIAKKFPENSVGRAIVLAISEAADTIVEAIQNVSAALKDGNFWENIGAAIERIASEFAGDTKMIIQTIGSAIAAGGQAIAILVREKLDGIKNALDVLMQKFLGIPADFDRLADKVKAEFLKAKEGSGLLQGFENLLVNIERGVGDLAETLGKLPWKIGEALGSLGETLAQFVQQALEYLRRLLGLVRAEAPPVIETPIPAPEPVTPAPAPATPLPESGIGKLLLIAAGGLGGALVGGPVGAAVGVGLAAAVKVEG